jgi:hypothetical protein
MHGIFDEESKIEKGSPVQNRRGPATVTESSTAKKPLFNTGRQQLFYDPEPGDLPCRATSLSLTRMRRCYFLFLKKRNKASFLFIGKMLYLMSGK